MTFSPGPRRAPAGRAALFAGALALFAAAAPADAQDGLGIVHSFAGGVLAHDRGVFSSNDEDGVDINLEIQFVEPGADWWRFIGSPRPRIGGNINTSGDTSLGYAGLYWDYYVLDEVFLAGGLGASVHNGEIDEAPGEKELGSRVLFHLAAELGWRFAEQHALSIYADHSSNANLADENEGLENVGVRYHFFFGGRN
jgi:hypothetical protein